MKLSPLKGRPGRDRLKFLLLLTPYRKLIEEEVEDKTEISMAEVRIEPPEERKRQEKKIRQKFLYQTRNSVNRAWKELNLELPEAVIALLLALQFHIWRD